MQVSKILIHANFIRRQVGNLLPLFLSATLLAVGCGSFLVPPLFAQGKVPAAPTLREIANRVDTHYNRLHSLSVQFTETYQGMGMKRTESGTLLLAKPGRMRWSYAQPAGKLFLLDGKYGYSYTPGDAQAERYPVKQLDDFRSPLRFLLGHTRIEKELEALTMSQDGRGFVLRGVPKDMGQQVSEVVLTVTPDGTIEKIEWKGIDGATTAFQLSNEQSNPPVSSGAFSFLPPAGVDVVRGLPPI